MLAAPRSCSRARSSSSSRSALALLRRRRSAPSFRPRAPTRRVKSTTSLEERAANATSTATATAAAAATTERPSNTQLWRVFVTTAVPMIGFGFTDQTVMIQAGNAIDCTLGVTFSLSTLTAAAFGQIISDASGVVFGGTVERLARAAGLPSANLTAAQRLLPVVSQMRWAGSFVGVILGCTLGLVNLFFIDTSRSSTLKLQALNEGQDFEFTVEASNAQRPDATALTVEGPDVDGILASMTTTLAKHGCSIVEISAKRAITTTTTTPTTASDAVDADATTTITTTTSSSSPPPVMERAIRDVFYVVDRETGLPFDDDELEMIAQALLEATRTPLRNIDAVHAATAAVVANEQQLQRQQQQQLKQQKQQQQQQQQQQQLKQHRPPLSDSYSQPPLFTDRGVTLKRRMTLLGRTKGDSPPPAMTRRITVVRNAPPPSSSSSSSAGQ